MPRSAPARTVLAVALWLALSARAQTTPYTRGIDMVPNKPTTSQRGGIALDTAQMLGAKSFRLAVLFDLNIGVLALKLADEKLGDLIPYRFDGHLIGAYQFHRRFELGVDMPFTIIQGDNFQLLRDEGFPESGIARAGLGDLRLAPKFILFSPEQFGVGLAAVGELRFPTGDGTSFIGERAMVFAPRAVAEIPIGDLRLVANLGMRLRYPGQYLNLYVGDEVTMGVGGIFRLPELFGGRLTNVDLMAEMHLATPRSAPFNFAQAASLKTPWEGLLGIRAKVYKNWGAELSFGRGITGVTGYGREAFRVLFGLRFDFEFADRDNDGIRDDIDKCPDEPEDKDGFQDEDGCPDPDNDQDGVLDKEDGCPNQPGTKAMDGCPDTDGDEVPDNVDGCPEIPGPPENNGCPVEGPPVVLESDRIRIRGNINFEIDSAKINPNSYKLLDDVYEVLAKNPEVGPVLVEGHTDNTGSRPYNLNLSKLRAKSVVDYLVKKGINHKRLKSDGFGFDRPVASNDDALGRAKNRRTEFRLIDEGPKPEEEAPKKPEEAPKKPEEAPKKAEEPPKKAEEPPKKAEEPPKKAEEPEKKPEPAPAPAAVDAGTPPPPAPAPAAHAGTPSAPGDGGVAPAKKKRK